MKTLEETQLSSTRLPVHSTDRNSLESVACVGFRLTSIEQIVFVENGRARMEAKEGRSATVRRWLFLSHLAGVRVFDSNYEEQNEAAIRQPARSTDRDSKPTNFDRYIGRSVRGCWESRPTINSTSRARF